MFNKVLTYLLTDISLLSEHIPMKLAKKYSTCEWALLKRFSRSKIKGDG